jgi:DNA excision repair protein ERCC-2
LKYLVAVRALCEFTAKRGDLDLRFTPSPSAQEGIEGHQWVASRREEHYEAEVSLSGEYKSLVVRGRADGYDPQQNLLEEVKTFRGDLHHMPDNHRALHWAQVKIYGWLLCQARGLSEIDLSLVYFDIASLRETPLTEHFDAASLREFFESCCEQFLRWAEQELAHRQARDAGLTELTFPHASFRPGQRELAAAVWRAGSNGRCLMAQAPTGIGKTVGTLFPLLKTAPAQRLDKIFFLAAKTPGRRLALHALERLVTDGKPPLRVLELVARDKACEHPDKACHGDACPLAKGFYDRLPQAREAAVALASSGQALDRAALREVARQQHVCPYYLSQDLVHWSDVVIGDYNYYFDSSAMLHGMSTSNQWKVSVLVDEAHNLVERARKMYTATLDQDSLHSMHAAAPRAVRQPLERLDRSWNELTQPQAENYKVYPDLPAEFLKALQKAVSAITDFLVANPTRTDAALQDFYFEALHFARMAEQFNAHSLFDISISESAGALQGGQPNSLLCIRNVVPAPFLAPRFAAAKSVTLFSATLSPADFYSRTLGLPQGTAWMDVESPFMAQQLRVSAVRNISTRYKHREQSLSPIADLMARQYRAQPGNYLAFLSSYDYLQKLARLFRERYPEIPLWEQTRQMDEAGREQFLARFTPDSRGIGFAVLGGSFAEGIDLPGRRLIGAFIATLGMPQVNQINEEIRRRVGEYFNAQTGDGDGDSGQRRDGGKAGETRAAGDLGYNYTYLYPGLQKVVQAAGRVIRTESDEGVIYLMDDRFTQAGILELLPAWWKVERLHAPRAATARALPL